jgi:hypothetical protein
LLCGLHRPLIKSVKILAKSVAKSRIIGNSLQTFWVTLWQLWKPNPAPTPPLLPPFSYFNSEVGKFGRENAGRVTLTRVFNTPQNMEQWRLSLGNMEKKFEWFDSVSQHDQAYSRAFPKDPFRLFQSSTDDLMCAANSTNISSPLGSKI